MFRTILGCTLCSIFLVSCDSSATNDSKASTELIPLAVGNAWIMEVADSLGNIPQARIFVDTLRVIRDTLVNGETWYEIVSARHWSLSPNVNGSNWYTNRDDGLWNRNSPKRPFTEATRVFPIDDDRTVTSQLRSGVTTVLVDNNFPFDLDEYGPVSTRKYELRLSDGFDPEDSDTAHPSDRFDSKPFNQVVNLTQHFSQSLGPVFLSGVYISLSEESEEIVLRGTLNFTLKKYIPAGRE